MTDPPLILSASSMSTWLSCGHRYLLSNIYRLRGRPSVAAAIGTAVHAGIEAHWKAAGAPRTALDAALDAEVERMAGEPDEDVSAARRDARRMLDLYIAEAGDFRPTLVEAPFSISVDGIGFTGVLDAADDEDLHDTKTRAGKTINGRKPSAFRPGYYQFQLSGYTLGYEHLTGRKPRRILIDLLDRKPSYRQVEIEPDVTEFVDVLHLVADGIEAGRYDPTGPANGVCRYCEYATVCEYAVLD